MANINCSACDELRTSAPDFIQNEMTDRTCKSLENNTGLNPSNRNTNCDDLHDAVDCLVGRMAQDVEAYEVCDWKEYMKKFVNNLYNTLKAMVCWLCGIQKNIDKIWCWLHTIVDTPKNYVIHAYPDDDPTKPPINGFRIADGVSMRSGTGAYPIRVSCMGNVAYVRGSLRFEGNMPTDYTNGETVAWSYFQQGCANIQNKDGQSYGANGNCWVLPLIWEIQFKECQLGFSDTFGACYLHNSANGDFRMSVSLFHKGDTVPPDHSVSDAATGSYVFNPSDDDMMLMQVRLQNTRLPLGAVTPMGNINVIACPSSMDC